MFHRGHGTITAPFWREAAYEFAGDAFWESLPFAERWSRLMPVSTDRFLELSWLNSLGLGKPEILMNRIDTRTYEEHPVIARFENLLVTTLRPFGGLGSQPTALNRNPAGVALLEALVAALEQ